MLLFQYIIKKTKIKSKSKEIKSIKRILNMNKVQVVLSLGIILEGLWQLL